LHDGWYFTGDTGYFDAEGDLFVTNGMLRPASSISSRPLH
jgi:hypothetical protein